MHVSALAQSGNRCIDGGNSILLVLPLMTLGGCAVYLPCPEEFVASPLVSTPPRECRVDGCSMAPDFDFADCCDRHDARYWSGGSAAQRKQADLEFRRCIEDKGHAVLAGVYYHGVRIGGTPYLPTPWRWGFGWEYLYGYEEEAGATPGATHQRMK